MAKLVYGLHQSLDGYVDHMKLGPPTPEVFQHFIELVRNSAGFVYGRRTYEIMRYWEEDQPDWDSDDRKFAEIWCGKPKWIVSKSLDSVGPNVTIIRGDIPSVVSRLKLELAGEIHTGGPVLAQCLTDAGLIDEYRIYLRPIVLGSGQPFFMAPRPPLRLIGQDLIDENMIVLSYAPA